MQLSINGENFQIDKTSMRQRVGAYGARTPQRQEGPEETRVVRRYRERDTAQGVNVDLDLSHGAAETALAAFARVATAAHRMAECLQRSTSEAGLADDAGRHGTGGPHHQPLSFIATWL